MIRFIDIRGQGTGRRFAFFDTCIDQFVTIDTEQVWDTWHEFEELVRGLGNSEGIKQLKRFRSLTPDWAFIDDPEDPLWKDDDPPPTIDLEATRHETPHYKPGTASISYRNEGSEEGM